MPELSISTYEGQEISVELSDGGAVKLTTAPPRPLGPELVINGNLDDATGWTVDAGWSVAANTASFVGSPSTVGATRQFSQNVAVTPGKTYRVALTVTGAVGLEGNDAQILHTAGSVGNTTQITADQVFVAEMSFSSSPVNIGAQATLVHEDGDAFSISAISLREML